MCTGFSEGEHRYTVTKTTVRHLKESSQNGCSWCNLLWAFLSTVENKDGDEIPYTATICFTALEEYHTPVGSRLIYLSVDPDDKKYHHAWSLRLNAYTPQDSCAARRIVARLLQTDTSTMNTRNQIASWMHDCAGHECCAPQIDVPLPSRVIELSPTDNPDRPRLISSNGRKGRYATLSHSWGTQPSSLLTTANIEGCMNGLDVKGLPLNIQNAITVAKSIPVDYLWVDNLCILHDSDADRTAQFAQIAQIYKNSVVTIVAADAKEINDGFLHTRTGAPTRVDDCRVWVGRRKDGSNHIPWTIPFWVEDSIVGTMSLRCLGCETEYQERNEIINTRAWTWQQQWMAPRVLFYGSHTLQWRCKHSVRNLGDSLHFDPDTTYPLYFLTRPETSLQHELLRWLRVMELYSPRKASSPSDKLPALASIAKEFSGSLGPHYYAGIWAGTKGYDAQIIEQLCW